MAEYIEAARRHRAPRTERRRVVNSQPGQRGPAVVDREQTKAIREWATRGGWTVSDRGRIPAHVVNAYYSRTATTSNVVADASTTNGHATTNLGPGFSRGHALVEPDPPRFATTRERDQAIRRWAFGPIWRSRPGARFAKT
jgi:hypothetical protein